MNKILVFSLALSFCIFSCKKEKVMRTYLSVLPVQDSATDSTVTTPDTPNTGTKYYLALGDSYTIGQSVTAPERYPEITVDKLNALQADFDRPEIIARTGWTTGNLLYEITSKPPSRATYDIVSLLIGVNNQYQGSSQSAYSTEFTTLLLKAIAYAGNRPKRVFVLSIPDYSVTPFAANSNKELIAQQIDAFNAINLQISQAAGVHYLDITPSTRQAASDPSLIAADGLHPSGKEYYKWASSLAPMIKAAL